MGPLDFIFHGGADLNAKMYCTGGFDDLCRKTFERWYLRIEGNSFNDDCRYLEMPVPRSDARLAIRTFWLKQAGMRAECFYLGVKLSRRNYEEAGDYYRLVSALRALSLDRIRELVSSGKRLDLVPTVPMQRQSMWKDFNALSGICMIGPEKFDENLQNVLLSISISNIDDWFDRMFLAIDPYFERQEFNVVVSKRQPKRVAAHTPSEGPFEPSEGLQMSRGLFAGSVLSAILAGIAAGWNLRGRYLCRSADSDPKPRECNQVGLDSTDISATNRCGQDPTLASSRHPAADRVLTAKGLGSPTNLVECGESLSKSFTNENIKLAHPDVRSQGK